jgi:hypothetical protein
MPVCEARRREAVNKTEQKAYWLNQYYTCLSPDERPERGTLDEQIHREEWVSGMMREGYEEKAK